MQDGGRGSAPPPLKPLTGKKKMIDGLTDRQRNIIRSMMPSNHSIEEVRVRTVDAFGTVSVEIPSRKIITRVKRIEGGSLQEMKVPLKYRFYIDRVGAFQYGYDLNREYFKRG